MADSLRCLLFAGLCVFGAADLAAKELGPHEHGHGTMNVVVEDSQLLIELILPAVNVVGFEHKPRSGEQTEAIRQALKRLGASEQLFQPSAAAGCVSDSVEASLVGFSLEGDQLHEEPMGSDTAHADFQATYSFHCDNPQALSGVELHLFEHLVAMDELATQVVTSNLQRGQAVFASNPVLKFAY